MSVSEQPVRQHLTVCEYYLYTEEKVFAIELDGCRTGISKDLFIVFPCLVRVDVWSPIGGAVNVNHRLREG